MSEPDYQSASRGVSGDMSPTAIARRLDIASQLYRLARTLAEAENLGPVEDDGKGESQVHEPKPDSRRSP